MGVGKAKVNEANQPKHREREKAEVKRRKEYREKVDELLDRYNTLKAAGDNEGAMKVKAEFDVRTDVFNQGGEAWIADIMAVEGDA